MTTAEPTSLWTPLLSRPGLARGGLLAVAGLLACTPGIEDYGRELEEAICEWQHECHAFERVRDCVDARVIDRDPQYDYLVRAAAAGAVAYDREAAAECLDQIRERGCKADSESPEVCERVFTGKIGRNEPCLTTAECAGNAVCGFDPSCTDQCCVGACRVFADPLAIGEACGFGGIACVPEAFCAQDPMTGVPTVCTARVKAGGDCSLGQGCVDDTYCDGVCKPFKEVPVDAPCGEYGVRCAEPATCNYNGSESRCKLEPTLGEPCEPGQDRCEHINTYCDSASKLCTLLPGPGQGCGESSCLPYANCISIEGSGRPPSCERLPVEGEVCAQYEACLGDLQCIDGRCALPALETAPVCKVPGA